jgi:hypothetical protein
MILIKYVSIQLFSKNYNNYENKLKESLGTYEYIILALIIIKNIIIGIKIISKFSFTYHIS